ncbi:MAG TPA: hypothetical protein DCZ03_16380 [Gammaproteobacteria bacterium]|nr:hypothetical protein [Gammaproteobacteria bacterium]
MGKILKGFITLTLLGLLLSCNGDDDAFIQGGSGSGTTAAAANNALVSGITVITGADTLAADGNSTVLVRATVVDLDGAAISNVSVDFTTSLGSPTNSTIVTDGNGLADFILTAPETSGTAQIVATTGGFSASATIQFLAGVASAGNSSITASPATLAADGASESTVTVTLADANGNLVADGTEVTLTTTDGTITTASPVTTTSGRATFTVVAPSSAATATLAISEVPGLTGSLFFGSQATGDPANIQVTAGATSIFVQDVGKTANTTISIQVLDAAGEAIDETLYGDTSLNNVQIEFLSAPNGEEFISGTDAAGNIVTAKAGENISIRTVNGSATLNLQSGTLPGVLEIRVTALLDKDGNLLLGNEQIVAALPQIVIASGPPHTIVLTSPVVDSITNLGGGVYRRIGTAIVTDRWGNTVPDGTAISFGLVDSVIAMGNDGVVASGSATLTGSGYLGDFQFDDTIVRNGTSRGVQLNDRMLILNSAFANKSRFVSSVASSTTLDVQSNFASNENGLNYLVGSSLVGASISGEDESGNLTNGLGTTKDGLATVRVTYPANISTILTGCYGYSDSTDPTTYSTLDTRYGKEESAQVIVVASATDSSATTTSAGQFCYGAIAPSIIDPTPDSWAAAGGTVSFSVFVTDANEIPLPFTSVSASVSSIERDAASTLTASVTAGPGRTNASGITTFDVTLAGTGVSGDTVTIQIGSGETTVDVTVGVP